MWIPGEQITPLLNGDVEGIAHVRVVQVTYTQHLNKIQRNRQLIYKRHTLKTLLLQLTMVSNYLVFYNKTTTESRHSLQAITCRTSSASSRSVLLILSIELFDPLYSKIAPWMLISFFAILTTKFPFRRKFPCVSDNAEKQYNAAHEMVDPAHRMELTFLTFKLNFFTQI